MAVSQPVRCDYEIVKNIATQIVGKRLAIMLAPPRGGIPVCPHHHAVCAISTPYDGETNRKVAAEVSCCF